MGSFYTIAAQFNGNFVNVRVLENKVSDPDPGN